MKTKKLGLLFLNLILVLLISACGEKKTETEKAGENKTGDENVSSGFDVNQPFMVEFGLEDIENAKGTIKAVYHGKKCVSSSNYTVDGNKISSTAYFDGGDVVYVVTDVMGKKIGMKFSKDKFSEAKDQIDINTFRDYLNQMDKVGEEEILGYRCEIYRHKEKDFSVSLYNKTVPLRMANREGKTIMKAVKFESPYQANDEMFIAPKDIEYMDMSEIMKDVEKMKDMKDPKMMKDKMKEMEDALKNYKK